MLCFGHITVNASKSAAHEKDLKDADKFSGSSEFFNFLSNTYIVYLFPIYTSFSLQMFYSTILFRSVQNSKNSWSCEIYF